MKLARIRIHKGTLWNTHDGVWYRGDDGRTVFFGGVRAVSGCTQRNSSFHFGGRIFIGRAWDTYDLQAFTHEYGHYLQWCEWGRLRYLWMGLRSVLSVLRDRLLHTETHFDEAYERDATRRGNTYLKHT